MDACDLQKLEFGYCCNLNNINFSHFWILSLIKETTVFFKRLLHLLSLFFTSSGNEPSASDIVELPIKRKPKHFA